MIYMQSILYTHRICFSLFSRQPETIYRAFLFVINCNILRKGAQHNRITYYTNNNTNETTYEYKCQTTPNNAKVIAVPEMWTKQTAHLVNICHRRACDVATWTSLFRVGSIPVQHDTQ